MKDIIKKIETVGGAYQLSMEELHKAIEHYQTLDEHLSVHGDTYHLVWGDVHNTLRNLKSYLISRESRENNKAPEGA